MYDLLYYNGFNINKTSQKKLYRYFTLKYEIQMIYKGYKTDFYSKMLKLYNDEETLKIVPNIKCCTHV